MMTAASRPRDIAPQRIVVTVAGASLGTVFEWYDFFLYGSMASVIAAHFFSGVDDTTAYILALLTFAVGFAVRPLGAYLFGRMGDRIGRKATFLTTMVLMGVATLAVGVLPGQSSIGLAAPLLLITVRLVQGLAMGGEYGGAAIYVAEHCPPDRRGFFTSFIQVTASAGLILSLVVTLATRSIVGEAAFATWGWRLPFLLSAVLLVFSIWFRKGLQETPEFEAMAAEARRSHRDHPAVFGRDNLVKMLLALFGLCVGMTAIWYTSQFYALFFLEKVVKVDPAIAETLVSIALLMATPFFVVFGWLSDKIGRRSIILTACLLAALFYQTLFHQLTVAANPALASASEQTEIVLAADSAHCSMQFDPIGRAEFLSSCDIAKRELIKAGIGYRRLDTAAGTTAAVRIGDQLIPAFEGAGRAAADVAAHRNAFGAAVSGALARNGFPASADPTQIDRGAVVAVLFLMNLLATMCYGPLVAALIELFPVAQRYTSVSIPYNIATGWVGGFLPAAAFAIVIATGNIYAGLWYPIAFAILTLVTGLCWSAHQWRSRRRARPAPSLGRGWSF